MKQQIEAEVVLTLHEVITLNGFRNFLTWSSEERHKNDD